MKKIVVLIAFIMAPIFTNAQSIFDTLEDMDGVDMVIVTKDAFELLNKFKPKSADVKENEVMQAFEMINDLNEFKMFSTTNLEIASKMEKMVNSAIKKSNLIQLMRIKEDNSRIKIYVKATKNKDYVSEVLMFVKGIDKQTKGMSEAMVMSLTGNIDINKMSDFTDKIVKENK
jgi:cobalamin biosynthesis protein CbiD